MTDFAAFFESLWQKQPFPWQTMLAERGVSGDWPEAINLPTASGKTACIDAAILALAATAGAAPEKRMPRRIWFVVDRRLVVDEAFERAKRIARKLAQATEGPVKEVADGLRGLSGTGRPLAVARLRGGAWRDDGWARLPSQPAIVCSTVDQVGSALLFRAYGHSDSTASIYAGLAAHDSLIVLDEAHCAVPFLQTLGAVKRFRAERWAQQPLRTPFLFSVMSATPPIGIPEEATFPRSAERAVALNHPILEQRFTARKLAALVPVKATQFVAEAASCARKFAETQGKHRVAVMVNRVATAEQIAEQLCAELGDAARTVLLTGRMRPLDRDALVERWEPLLKAGSEETPPKPLIVVTTQCLEVGADFSFDALVTECASLDALRQRFGRLDRLGTLGETAAVILIRAEHTKEPEDEDADAIYGKAIYETWKWLNEPDRRKAEGAVDFGIEAMNSLIGAFRESDEERFRALLAPTPDAPILLPAHLDLLCQTSPRPVPEPDVSLFLHGKGRGVPEARVVLRADLPEPASDREAQGAWIEVLSLVPPTSPEMLTVPLYRLRRCLAGGRTEPDGSADVEGVPETSDEKEEPPTRKSHIAFLLWRGRDHSEFARDPQRIRQGDVVVLRLDGNGFHGLGQSVTEPEGLGAERLDLAERSLRQARRRVVLRLQRDVLAPLRGHPSVAHLLNLATPEADQEEIESALQAALEENSATPDLAGEASPPALPGWLKETIERLVEDGFRIEDHSAGGCILMGKQTRALQDKDDEVEDDPLADEEDLTSKSGRGRTLLAHTADVYAVVSDFAPRCLPPELAEVFANVAQWHDLGKLDRRFQIMLRNGAQDAAEAEPPLAKSESLPEGRGRRLEICQDFRLPRGFRHEFLSLQLAERSGLTPGDDGARDLTLHLIASHHGHARPFAPVTPESLLDGGKQPAVSMARLGLDFTLTADERQALPPAYRLDSGVPDRFWRLTRRYGWWGLAYLEAVFRLADWQASRTPGTGEEQRPFVSPSLRPFAPPPASTIALDALNAANPLAFLAALGTVRSLARAWPDRQVSLAWQIDAAFWRPVIQSDALPGDRGEARRLIRDTLARTFNLGFKPGPEAEAERHSSQKAFEEARRKLRNKLKDIRSRKLKGHELKEAKEREAAPLVQEVLAKRAVWLGKLRSAVPSLEMALGQRINVPPEEFLEFCELALASDDRWIVDQLAHFGSDACWDRRRREIRPTPFSFVNGSGRQFFLDTARQLVSAVNSEQVYAALFREPWRPRDEKLSMRWNPSEDRRYALMAEDPTAAGNEPKTVWAANLLAYAGLGLLPSAPTRRGLGTVGVVDRWENPAFTWPVWRAFLSSLSVSSLLALPELTVESPPREILTSMGIEVVFRSERIEVGDGANMKVNFTFSRPL